MNEAERLRAALARAAEERRRLRLALAWIAERASEPGVALVAASALSGGRAPREDRQ